jgi:hypothetical protein
MQLFSLTSQAGGEESWELITMGVLESLGASSALIKPHLNNEHMLFIFLESCSEGSREASPTGSLVARGPAAHHLGEEGGGKGAILNSLLLQGTPITGTLWGGCQLFL